MSSKASTSKSEKSINVSKKSKSGENKKQVVPKKPLPYLAFYGAFISAGQLLGASFRFKDLHKTLQGIDRLVTLQQSSQLKLENPDSALIRLPFEVMSIIRSFVKQDYIRNALDHPNEFDNPTQAAFCEDCDSAVCTWSFPHWCDIQDEEPDEDDDDYWDEYWGMGDEGRRQIEKNGEEKNEELLQEMLTRPYPFFCKETEAKWTQNAMCKTAHSNEGVVALLKEYNLKSSVRGYQPICFTRYPPVCEDSNQIVAIVSNATSSEGFCTFVSQTPEKPSKSKRGKTLERGKKIKTPFIETVDDLLSSDVPHFLESPSASDEKSLTSFLEDWSLVPVTYYEAAKVSAWNWMEVQARIQAKSGQKADDRKAAKSSVEWWCWDIGTGGRKTTSTNTALRRSWCFGFLDRFYRF